MSEKEEVILPEKLPFTATLESGHQTRKCDHCEKHPLSCNRYVLRFPEDAEFLEWESGRSTRRTGAAPLKAYVPHKPLGGTAIDGWFCSETCALKSYFPIYCLWRLQGKR